jgi:hypothetical protein
MHNIIVATLFQMSNRDEAKEVLALSSADKCLKHVLIGRWFC